MAKRAPQDSTLRNVRAANKRLFALAVKVEALTARVERLEQASRKRRA